MPIGIPRALLQRISFAYYQNNQFSEALTSFDEAIDKDIIDPDRIEIMNIRQDIYFHMAREQENNGEYLKAAESYLNSISILRQIRSDFTDTNEAFIAQYKIPQYLFDASEDYKKSGDIIFQTELLEEIIKPQDIVLVKGSRTLQLEEIVAALTRPVWGGNG